MKNSPARGISNSQERDLIKVALADKNPMVLSGVKHLLESDGRFRVVATASDGERFLELARRHRFDVGIVGWEMPRCGGRAVLQALRVQPRGPRIVIYTGSRDPELPREVMALGGAGFCAKIEPPERLLAVVLEVAAGRMSFPFVDVRRLGHDPLAMLTRRERELLQGLAAGRTNARLATDLGVSVNTIKFHLKNLYEKLAVRNRAEAVAMGMRSRRGAE
jgi:two-component system nitrate/nitrite response regulator NarP